MIVIFQIYRTLEDSLIVNILVHGMSLTCFICYRTSMLEWKKKYKGIKWYNKLQK